MSTTVLSPATQLKGLLCWNFIEYQRTYLEMSTQFILCLQNWLEIISKCLLYIVHESLGHKRNICKLFSYLGSYNRPHQTVRSFGVWFWDSRLKFQYIDFSGKLKGGQNFELLAETLVQLSPATTGLSPHGNWEHPKMFCFAKHFFLDALASLTPILDSLYLRN